MPESRVLVGQVLDGRYRIERPLGAGGVGEVYLGRHQRTGRLCAIKFLSEQGRLDHSSVRRFEREARALGRLRHPGIVGIHDFAVTPEGVPYLVMDYLEGEDLAHRLRRDGAMDWETAAPLFREMAHALHTAHGSGVLHRDLKPGNVFIARTPGAPDRAVLLDFGLARAQDSGLEELSLTRTGAVFGTPLYMSPEQARGARLDPRSDLYSLATILFEMLAGRTPFIGENITQLISHLLMDPVPALSELSPHKVPTHLDAVLEKALAKDPEARYPEVASFAAAVLEEPLVEQWKRGAEHPPSPALAETLPSDPPQTGPPRAPSSSEGPAVHQATGLAQPVATPGTGPEQGYYGTLAIQKTVESGELSSRRRLSEDPARAQGEADHRETTQLDRPGRQSSTSWMLHLGIMLLGLAAAAAVFWQLLGSGSEKGSPAVAPSMAASPAVAKRNPTPLQGPGGTDATAGDPMRSTGPASPMNPRNPETRAGVLRRKAPAAPMPVARRVASRFASTRRSTPRLSTHGPMRPAHPRTAPAPRAHAMGAATGAAATVGAAPFGQKLFAASQLRVKAVTAERRGKGRACLALLDKADRMHPESAAKFHYLRGWCLMRAGRCAEGRRVLARFYRRQGTPQISSRAMIQWAENAKCPASTGTPQQQLARVHQQLTTACAVGRLKRCEAYVATLRSLVSRLPRPLTAKQRMLVTQGYMRAAIRLAKVGRCRKALGLFQRTALARYGQSSQASTASERWLRIYGKGCPPPSPRP